MQMLTFLFCLFCLQMKMGNIFEKNATFDKMFTPKFRSKSNICTVLQKAVISVDEDGTEAAAVTGK